MKVWKRGVRRKSCSGSELSHITNTVCVKDIEYSELCLHEVQLLISASESKHYRGVSVGWVWSVEGRENW